MGNDRHFIELRFHVGPVPRNTTNDESKRDKGQMIWGTSVQCVGYVPGLV